MRKRLISILALLLIAVSGAWAEDVTYALSKNDTFTSGQTVDVKNGNDVVATITYGESGGNDFNAAKTNSSVSGYTAFTEGNGTNGNSTGGTFYTIVPQHDGTIDVAVVLNASKAFYILEDGKALEDYNGITVDAKYYGTYSFSVSAKKSYKFYCAGSKLGFYGFKYTYTPSQPDPDPQPQPAGDGVDYALTVGENAHGTITFKVGDETVTTAQEGQTVTVVITPAEGWVVNQPSGQWYAAIAASRRVAPQNLDLLDAVTLTPAGENTWTFTMQRANVEISSTYKKLLTNADITILDIQAPTYSGQALEPAVTVKDGSAVLVKDVDYTVTYSNNTDAALATATKAPTVTVTAVATSEKYAGETTKTFTIQPKALASDLIAAIDALTYTGQALEPQPVVTYNDMTLEKGKDYSVTYANNVNAGTATLTVTAAQNPNYSGSATKDFTVQKKALEAGFIAAIDALIYTGQAQTPEPVVTYNDMTLEKGKDYSVAYADNVNPGTATVTVTAAAACNYSGTASKTFTIQKKEVESGFIGAIDAMTYSGQAQTPDPALTFNGMTLVKGTDYLIGYTNNVNAGTATVTVTGIGFYSGNASKTFTIQKKALSVTADDKEVTYGDDAPEYTVTYDGFVNGETASVLGGTLALDCSYVKNESGAGVYIIRPSGLTSNNYAITNHTGTLTVGKKSLKDEFVAAVADVTYSGQAQKPAPVVTFNGMTLAANTDYSVTYANNKNAGTATMTVTGKGDYSGTVTKEFAIRKAALTVTAEDKSVSFGASAPRYTATYAGFVNSESMGVLGGTLTFQCPYVKGQSGVGEYAITPGGLTSANYDITFADGKLTVGAKALSANCIATIGAQTYTGQALEPEVTVKDGSTVLVKDVDYTVAYESNVNVGTARVTVTGKGNYSGTASKTFAIVEPEPETIPVMTEADPVSTVDGETFYHLGLDEQTTEQVSALVSTEDAGEFLNNLGLSSNAQKRLVPTETGLKVIKGENVRMMLKDMKAGYTITIDFTGKIRMLKGALAPKDGASARRAAGESMELVDNQGYSITEDGDMVIELETLASPVEIHKITVTKDETTGIRAVSGTPAGNGTIYTLDGRRLDSVPTKKGVYILNGKKVVMK